MGTTIYKVLTTEQCRVADAGGPVEAPVDIADGYVHFSTRETLQGTLDKWFVGQEGCVLLAYDADDFGAELRWEPSRDDLLFPHVYGRVNTDGARGRWTLMLGPSGAPLAPDGL